MSIRGNPSNSIITKATFECKIKLQVDHSLLGRDDRIERSAIVTQRTSPAPTIQQRQPPLTQPRYDLDQLPKVWPPIIHCHSCLASADIIVHDAPAWQKRWRRIMHDLVYYAINVLDSHRDRDGKLQDVFQAKTDVLRAYVAAGHHITPNVSVRFEQDRTDIIIRNAFTFYGFATAVRENMWNYLIDQHVIPVVLQMFDARSQAVSQASASSSFGWNTSWISPSSDDWQALQSIANRCWYPPTFGISGRGAFGDVVPPVYGAEYSSWASWEPRMQIEWGAWGQPRETFRGAPYWYTSGQAPSPPQSSQS